MLSTGFIGGAVGHQLLCALGRQAAREDHCTGAAYRGCSKLEALFGPGIWTAIEGRTVVDVGCGFGLEAIEMAERGAHRVVGLDIRDHVLAEARRAAALRGLADRCVFTAHTEERADVIVSIDGFEHYD